MSIPSPVTEGLLVGGSSLIAAAAGGLEEALGGHQGLIKNYRGSGFVVSDISVGIIGSLPHILCAKAQ